LAHCLIVINCKDSCYLRFTVRDFIVLAQNLLALRVTTLIFHVCRTKAMQTIQTVSSNNKQ
jgi:hypothetical protein